MSARIKVCCIQSCSEAEMALAAGVDALGLVGPMPSGPGVLADSEIRAITRTLPEAPSVLLSSARDVEAVCAHVARTRPKILQLVDEVDRAVFPALRQLYSPLKVWQVIHVEDDRAIAAALEMAPLVDAILLDSGAPKAEVKQLGGTGRVHNWDISAQIVKACPVPVWLAGGLGPHNVREAIRAVRPFGVDVCSGLRKNKVLIAELLAKFVKEVAAT